MDESAAVGRDREEGLRPCAMRASASRGRVHAEEEAPYRGIYQRDRDRLVHCTAFRRLEYKTQVFVAGVEGDHYRTRLTHTLEVTQISRTAARALGLNEDLAEALALAHDLGHGPFGHSGEAALDEVMQGHGGFDHNIHGLRVVDKLERRYPGFPGLNLTYETREGFTNNLARGVGDPGRRGWLGFAAEESPPLEVQIVGHADEIAYNTHDLEDGLVWGAITEEQLEAVGLWRAIESQARAAHPRLAAEPQLRLRAVVRRLIDCFVTDLIAETTRRLKQHGIAALADVRACRRPLAGFSPELEQRRRELEAFLYKNLYFNPRVRQTTALWQERLKALFLAYRADLGKLPEEHLRRGEAQGQPIERVICDYIAGMTDRYAEKHWQALCG